MKNSTKWCLVWLGFVVCFWGAVITADLAQGSYAMATIITWIALFFAFLILLDPMNSDTMYQTMNSDTMYQNKVEELQQAKEEADKLRQRLSIAAATIQAYEARQNYYGSKND